MKARFELYISSIGYTRRTSETSRSVAGARILDKLSTLYHSLHTINHARAYQMLLICYLGEPTERFEPC